MKSSYRAALFLSVALFLTAGIASADSFITYQFTGGPVSASFELPVNPTVLAFTIDSDFKVTPIDLLLNGAPSSDFLVFFSTAMGGGFGAFSSDTTADINTTGPQLYSGPENAPTMLGLVSGGEPLTDFNTGDPAGTLTTPGTPVGTPEPSVTILLTIGLLAVGLATLRFKPNLGVSAS